MRATKTRTSSHGSSPKTDPPVGRSPPHLARRTLLAYRGPFLPCTSAPLRSRCPLVENSGDRRWARWRGTQQRRSDLRSPEFPTSCGPGAPMSEIQETGPSRCPVPVWSRQRHVDLLSFRLRAISPPPMSEIQETGVGPAGVARSIGGLTCDLLSFRPPAVPSHPCRKFRRRGRLDAQFRCSRAGGASVS